MGILSMGEVSEFLETWEGEGEALSLGPFVVAAPGLEQFKDMSLMLGSGVYVLLSGAVIVYVGQAIYFATRIASHRSDGRIKFDGVKLFPCKHKGRRAAMEKALITRYRPKYNERLMPKAHAKVGLKVDLIALGLIKSPDAINRRGL
jgi:hypothetical protein